MGLEPGFRLEGLCQMKSASMWPRSTSRALSRHAEREAWRSQGSFANAGRETCHWASQLSRQMSSTFAVNVFWDPQDRAWASALGLPA